MDRLDDNYYHRKCYLERDQVPTQTVMLDKMQPPLARVYFKSMSRPLKVYAGLQPPMAGGGKVWYMPPEDLLQSRAVLKPVAGEHLKYLGYAIIEKHSVKLVQAEKRRLDKIKRDAIKASDERGKERVFLACHQTWDQQSHIEAKNNVRAIQHAFHEFSTLYRTAITSLDHNLMQAAIKQIERLRQQDFQKKLEEYEDLIKQQATMLYQRYEKLLMDEKARLKAEFIQNMRIARHDMGQRIHDINVDKHVAIEKLRHLLECRNLACQVYVALKEREECKKEIIESKHEHGKAAKELKETIIMQDFEIHLEIAKSEKRKEFNFIWKSKVACIVKKFQTFVAYCLKNLPEVAEFFINMEKLMMLQMDTAWENPSVESLFIRPEEYLGPVAKPHPFRLFCDRGYKPEIDQKLCPMHCTSSASLLPALVINKKCVYAACDNFIEFSDKIKRYIDQHKRGDDIDFEDDHDRTYDIPVTYTSSQHQRELKFESSLMFVLQKEIANLKGVDTECRICKLPHCFHVDQEITSRVPSPIISTSSSVPSGNKIEHRSQELLHEREPKWGSYLDYVLPKKCLCSKLVKKHLQEHMPPYMIKRSKYEDPELINYEKCSIRTLKTLVRKTKGKDRVIQQPSEPEVQRTATIATQCADREYDSLCYCFSDDELNKFINVMDTALRYENSMSKLVQVEDHGTPPITPTYLSKTMNSFATDRAHSLRRLMGESSELKHVFQGFI